MATKEIKKVEEVKEGENKSKLEQICALWKKQSKAGKTYLEGSKTGEACSLIAFYNTNKKNPKEPDLRIYTKTSTNDKLEDSILDLWCNATEKGTKYLTGKFGDRRVVGFINNTDNAKRPYLSVYYQNEAQKTVVAAKKEETKTEGIGVDITAEDLPF